MEFPLVEIAVDFLVPGSDETYALRPAGRGAIQMGIKMLLESGADPVPALEALIGLARSLDTEFVSPTASHAVYEAMLSVGRVRAILGLAEERLDRQERMQSFLHGQRKAPAAPKYGAVRPKGTMPLEAVAPPRRVFR